MIETFKRAIIAFANEAGGFLFALYLRFVWLTNRFQRIPVNSAEVLGEAAPAIVAMWHGQHLMMTFAWPHTIRAAAAMISRHDDAEAQAVALRHLGVLPVRGSGGRRADRSRDKGGARALIKLKQYLQQGVTVAMTADAPKLPRVAGMGIVTLARISGRPIVPIAVVTSKRFVFDSWDRASVGKPFGRGVIVFGEFVRVPADADEAGLEAARRAVESGLDEAHRLAYERVGAKDPGAELRTA